MHSLRTALAVLLCIALFSGAAVAQAPTTPKPLKWGSLNVSGSWRVRMEAWDWFDATAEDTYGFAHSIFRLGVGQQRKAWDWQVELTVPALIGAPSNAIAPAPQGQLGLGASYYAANGNQTTAINAFLGKAFIRFKGFGAESNRLTLGRFEFVEGTETTPKDKTLAALKTMRLAHRLIGNFAFSMTGRANDGANLSLRAGSGNLTLVAARATRGVFQADGWGDLDAGYLYGAYTLPLTTTNSAGELRLFGIGYQDARAVVKTDSRPLPVRQGADKFENINIGTFGTHYAHVFNTKSAGKWDVLFWGAAQTGSWGLQDHRAGAAAVELGWQPEAKTLKPWIRLGYFVGSGDGDPSDNQHNTFFQMLPTPRWYARYPFYNFQNNQDISAMLILRPHAKVNIRSEVHALSLTSRRDLWYQGGGAFQRNTFGYVGRPGGGNRGLGDLWDVSLDYQLTPAVGMTFYFANVWGKGVMTSVYPAGQNSRFGYSEFTYRF